MIRHRAKEGAAGHTFQGQEAAGCDANPFEPDTGRTDRGEAAVRCLGCGEAARCRLRGQSDAKVIRAWASWPRPVVACWRRCWSLLRRCLAEFFLGLLLFAALLGDALFELLQPFLEQTDLADVSSARTEIGWQAAKAPKAIAATAILLFRFSARTLLT